MLKWRTFRPLPGKGPEPLRGRKSAVVRGRTASCPLYPDATYVIAYGSRLRPIAGDHLPMQDSDQPATRRVEVHFGLEERAIVVDVDDSGSGADIGDAVVEALEASDVDDAVRHLRARIGGGSTTVRLVRGRQ
jgi:hypothetical protein